MRIFGACLAVIGAGLGLIIGIVGWFILVIGLLIMIAAPNKVKAEKEKPISRQSTGGYAGLKKKPSHSEFNLGTDLGSRHLGLKQTKKDDPWGNREFMEK